MRNPFNFLLHSTPSGDVSSTMRMVGCEKFISVFVIPTSVSLAEPLLPWQWQWSGCGEETLCGQEPRLQQNHYSSSFLKIFSFPYLLISCLLSLPLCELFDELVVAE